MVDYRGTTSWIDIFATCHNEVFTRFLISTLYASLPRSKCRLIETTFNCSQMVLINRDFHPVSHAITET